jgi:ATP-dependent Clp protease ATP-binding subunit ClpC
MPFLQLRKIVEHIYSAPLYLRAYLPPEKREFIQSNLFVAAIFFLVISIVTFFIGTQPIGNFPFIHYLPFIAPRIYGIFLMLLSVTFVFSALEALHRSYYFTGLSTILNQTRDDRLVPISWEVATIIDETRDDITGDFITSNYGQEILYRAGINEKMFAAFEANRTPNLTPDAFVVERDKGIVLASYVKSIYKHDEAFRTFLAKNNIHEDHLLEAARWVTDIERKERQKRRWWSKDMLGRMPGLGKTWEYGSTFYLEKFGHDLVDDHIWPSAVMSRREEDDEVEAVEEILSRGRQSNVLLLSNDVVSARRRVAQLYYKIRGGHTLPVLDSRRIFFIDIESIVIAYGEKSAFENAVRATFNQAVEAGNAMIYLEHISSTIESAKVIGVDIVDVISPYLESPEIQIVIGELNDSFEKRLSRDSRITQAFDVVQMMDVSSDGVFQLLKQRARTIEKQTGIVFTVPAIMRIGDLADRYFPTGVMPDKAFDLLEELVPMLALNGLKQVLKTDVEHLVTKKTHVPTGEPEKEERETLMHLEDALHKRVIAQDSAVDAIARALRRARSGVGNPKKPMGTFLFLGPTGVGKTETAKALAEILFNDEEAMSRLDMSEFQTPDSLGELIGVPGSEAEGRLETLVRKRQYGVLLLDEFEKSFTGIHDLFLQILDEGRYTTAAGKPVNLRNLVIIATSNAGADLIWQWEQEGKDASKQKDALIDHMVSAGLYRPEFLNRFDDIIIFHALKAHHVKEIAKLHLKSFAKRVFAEKNINVEITDDLISYVAEKGYDPKFGGRPLTRAIQEEVEQRIADEVLAGNLKAGDTYHFKK